MFPIIINGIIYLTTPVALRPRLVAKLKRNKSTTSKDAKQKSQHPHPQKALLSMTQVPPQTVE